MIYKKIINILIIIGIRTRIRIRIRIRIRVRIRIRIRVRIRISNIHRVISLEVVLSYKIRYLYTTDLPIQLTGCYSSVYGRFGLPG